MNSLEETKYIMKKYKIKANKNLGQNFLIEDNVISAIVKGANVNKNDLIIEIGPGLGTLTNQLLQKAKKVICIELDKKMVEILKDRFSLYDNFKIIEEDVLKINLQELVSNQKEQFENIKVVANLPYYITTPIITKLLESKVEFESITVMIQKEVADRLIEIPGGKNTGAITHLIYYYCEGKKIIEVSADSFEPSPKVKSEVIKLKIRKTPIVEVQGKALMFKIIKCAFLQRRKTLLNSLVNAQIFETKEEGEKVLEKLKLEKNIRPEELTIQNFADITNEFIKSVTNKK